MIEDLFIDIDIISKSLTILATEKEAFLEINVDNISGILADKTLTSSKKLNELFLKYFRAEYDKVKHGRLFAKIIYQHKPQLLEPFVSKIKQAISKIEKA